MERGGTAQCQWTACLGFVRLGARLRRSCTPPLTMQGAADMQPVRLCCGQVLLGNTMAEAMVQALHSRAAAASV